MLISFNVYQNPSEKRWKAVRLWTNKQKLEMRERMVGKDLQDFWEMEKNVQVRRSVCVSDLYMPIIYLTQHESRQSRQRAFHKSKQEFKVEYYHTLLRKVHYVLNEHQRRVTDASL